MDLSKLPRFSKTDRPASGPADEAGELEEPGSRSGVGESERKEGMGAEVWISVVVGAVLIVFFPRIWQYYLMPGSFTWTFTDPQGLPLAYPKTAFYLVDLGVALFALTLFLEAVAMMCPRSVAIRGSVLTITILVVLMNIGIVIGVMNAIGLQLMPVLAAGFGVYNAVYQWPRLKRTLMIEMAKK